MTDKEKDLACGNSDSAQAHVRNTASRRNRRNEKRASGTSRRDFLRSTATLSAGLLLAGKVIGQETPAPAPAAPAAAAPAADAPAAAPAAAAPPAAAPAPAAAPGIVSSLGANEELRIAIIGTGAQGGVLQDAILKIPNVRIVAVCDIWEYNRTRATRQLKRLGHENKAYVDYQDLLASEKDLDAAVVATPDFMHAEHAIACMKAGLHVYCEKEMSNSLEKARQMVLTSRETGRLLQIGHQRRSNPRYRHAFNTLLREMRLAGRVTHAYAQWNRSKSEDLGWGKKFEIPPDVLEKYGYDSMSHFRNWRWYKKYGGGPIVDLGSHQIDLFSWVFGVQPKCVMAAGGVDFYPHHEWYDNVLAIYDYQTPEGISRAFYQVLTTTSTGSFHEVFMGENGTLKISEVTARGDEMLREPNAPEWDTYVQQGLLLKKAEVVPLKKTKNTGVDVRESPPPEGYPLPIQLNKPAHQPHLENFFDAIRIGTPLNCPGEIGYETAVAVLKANVAVEARRTLEFAPEEFKV